jgi:hypothetical protein
MNTEMRTKTKSRMAADLAAVNAEIATIKQDRRATTDKGLLIYGPRHKCRRLSELVGIRSSLQANIARF